MVYSFKITKIENVLDRSIRPWLAKKIFTFIIFSSCDWDHRNCFFFTRNQLPRFWYFVHKKFCPFEYSVLFLAGGCRSEIVTEFKDDLFRCLKKLINTTINFYFYHLIVRRANFWVLAIFACVNRWMATIGTLASFASWIVYQTLDALRRIIGITSSTFLIFARSA